MYTRFHRKRIHSNDRLNNVKMFLVYYVSNFHVCCKVVEERSMIVPCGYHGHRGPNCNQQTDPAAARSQQHGPPQRK